MVVSRYLINKLQFLAFLVGGFLLIVSFLGLVQTLGMSSCLLSIHDSKFNPCYRNHTIVSIHVVPKLDVFQVGLIMVAVLFMYGLLTISCVGMYFLIYSDYVYDQTSKPTETDEQHLAIEVQTQPEHHEFRVTSFILIAWLLSTYLLYVFDIWGFINFMMFPVVMDMFYVLLFYSKNKDPYNKKRKEHRRNFLIGTSLVSISLLILKSVSYYLGVLQCRLGFGLNPCREGNTIKSLEQSSLIMIHLAGMWIICISLIYSAILGGINYFYYDLYLLMYIDRVPLNSETPISDTDEIVVIDPDNIIIKPKHIKRKIVLLIGIACLVAHYLIYRLHIIYGILFYLLFPVVCDILINFLSLLRPR